jgi:4-aminobutyrate aminotransferase-like enzyme
MWGYETAGVVPDIVTLGKPMGNGHPLAAAVCRSDLGNEFREKVMYFNTFGGNPVSCAVGLAVLNIIEEENLIENARQVGKYIKEGLDNLADQFDLIGDVRGKGLIFAVELVTDRESKKPAQEKTRQIVNLMKEQGVLISRIGMGDNILKMRPPICFSRDNADVLLTNLELVFSRLSN